jgi:hypothetical protein
VDGEIGVVEIVFAGEVALELEGTEISLELLPTRLELGSKGLVVLFLQEVVAGQEVVVFLLEPLDQGLGVLEPREGAGDLLGRLGVGPEAGLPSLGLEPLYFPPSLSGVKDDPSLR